MRAADGRLIDLKELLRRASKRGKGGKQGEMERFLELARGQKPGGKGGKPGGEGGKACEGKDVTMLMPGGEGGADLIMPGQGGGKPGGSSGGQGEEPGDGVGDGHDPNLLGQKTTNQVKTVEEQVTGREGEGSAKSRVIFAAAKKGFASKAWGAVHQDYSVVVEDALEGESIPAGKRRYVRRYFELIRPR